MSLCSAPGSAQTELYEFTASGWFGYSVAGAGDVNADGYPDVIVGARDNGHALVYSGVDGSLLYSFHGAPSNDYFAHKVSGAGDVNADGYADVIVGAQLDSQLYFSAGKAYVFSGRDGSTLHVFDAGGSSWFFGSSVSGAGDVDADGYDDLIVGARGAQRARVHSGANGELLYEWSGTGYFGWSVSGAGDLNRDGHDDVMVGASSGNYVRIFSGADGALLHELTGPSQFGYSLSDAGDVDADGWPDLIVGARYGVSGLKGSAYVYSGKNMGLLHMWREASIEARFGCSVDGAGDVDGDGFDDLVVGAAWDRDESGLDVGSAQVFSGRTGQRLHIFFGQDDDEYGRAVAGVGDVNGDGLDDVAIGAPRYGNDGGLVHVISCRELVGASFCAGDGGGVSCRCDNVGAPGEGCSNSSAAGGRLTGQGSGSVQDDDLAFVATRLPARQPALLVSGHASVPGVFLGDGLLCLAGIARLGRLATERDGTVRFGPGLGHAGGWIAGDTRYFQCSYRDPGGPCGAGFNLTNAVEVAFTP